MATSSEPDPRERPEPPTWHARPGRPRTVAAVRGRRNGRSAPAAVAASSRYIAEDACELIDVEYELLPVVADPCVATDPGSALLYEENGTNLMLDRAFTWGDIDGVFAAAD